MRQNQAKSGYHLNFSAQVMQSLFFVDIQSESLSNDTNKVLMRKCATCPSLRWDNGFATKCISMFFAFSNDILKCGNLKDFWVSHFYSKVLHGERMFAKMGNNHGLKNLCWIERRCVHGTQKRARSYLQPFSEEPEVSQISGTIFAQNSPSIFRVILQYF